MNQAGNQGAEAAEGNEAMDEQNAQLDQEPQSEPRMSISEQERQQALAIKRAIEEDTELENLTDFQYVQAAIIDGDDIQAALDRVFHMQAFREEYKIRDDDFDDATYCIKAFLRQHAGVILSIAYNSDENNYVLIWDWAAFNQENLNNPESWRIMLAFIYFELNALNPDFYSIRKGIVFVVECEGFDWKKCDVKTSERGWTELLTVYPTIFRQLKYFHTGVFANLSASLMKHFLPEHIRNKIQVGCEYEGRLDTLYLVPSLEAANNRILERLQICLKNRYENEKRFRL
jgi:hypothetical protein